MPYVNHVSLHHPEKIIAKNRLRGGVHKSAVERQSYVDKGTRLLTQQNLIEDHKSYQQREGTFSGENE